MYKILSSSRLRRKTNDYCFPVFMFSVNHAAGKSTLKDFVQVVCEKTKVTSM